ncbi:hypothetical protein QWY99_18655 [Flavobacterium branchiarum]|uniref:Uncharacterized protein n=1 Tax=Flavobacterium branchiarum TaxID=1114870 RepID=A0ABV5FIM3_9FLAO|nr:hypothetical protein [Flavobacterium branchiarum]MDN3675059.1 hypothetical protein [Flavobacterium branchiarum]
MKKVALILISLFSSVILKAQEKTKDTLFFNYDNKYIRTHAEIPNHFYLQDGSGSNYGSFYFQKVKNLDNQKTNKKTALCLKDFVQSSAFYDKNKNPKLNDYKLWEYFNSYVVILVKKNHQKIEFIQVGSAYEIE